MKAVLLLLVLALPLFAQFAGRWSGPLETTVVGNTTEVGTIIMDIDTAGNITHVIGSHLVFAGSVDSSGEVTFDDVNITPIRMGQINGDTMTATATFTPAGSPFPIRYDLTATRETTGGGGGSGGLPDPGNLIGFRDRLGETLIFEVTGTTNGVLYGTGTYTDDSPLSTAAVHAGILDVGETGLVAVTITGNEGPYASTTQNGITSRGWQSWDFSYRVESVSTADFTIVTEPADVRVLPGDSATLAVVVSALDVSYQWYRGEVSDRSNPIPGATFATLTFTATEETSYWVEISNASGSVSSRAAVVSVGLPAGSPEVLIRRDGLNVVLIWEPGKPLYYSPDLTPGSWSVVPNATPPHTIVAAGRGFYATTPDLDVIAADSFFYGTAGDDLIGQNGGLGFTSAWMENYNAGAGIVKVPWKYDPIGLELAGVPSAGGSARYVTRSDLGNGQAGMSNRRLEAPIEDEIFVSFLYRQNSRTGTDNTAALMFGGEFDLDTNSTFSLNLPDFGRTRTGLRIEGQRPNSAFTGSDLVPGTTYLALFVLSPSLDSNESPSGTGWILSEAQYANFRNNLTPEALNAVAVSTAPQHVTQRGSFTINRSLGAMTHLSLFAAFDSQDSSFDEIRVSTKSLKAAVETMPGN